MRAIRWASGDERNAWIEVLSDTREEWQAAYEQRPSNASVFHYLGGILDAAA